MQSKDRSDPIIRHVSGRKAELSTPDAARLRGAGLGARIEVVKGRVEELSLELQVDVLISEPMGTLLVNERMLETYLYARDRFLKPGARWEPFFLSISFGNPN